MAAKIGIAEGMFWVFVLACTLNFITVRTLEIPIVYCAVQPVAKAVIGPWLVYLALFGVAYFVFKIAQRDMFGAFAAFFFTILVFGIPEYAETLFRLGGECVVQKVAVLEWAI